MFGGIKRSGGGKWAKRTDVPSIEEGKYCAYGKDIIILMHNHLDDWPIWRLEVAYIFCSRANANGRAAGIKEPFALKGN